MTLKLKTMKKILFVMLAVTLGLTNSLSAKSSPSAAAKLPADFKQEVTKHISYPDFARNNMAESVVTMEITLDKNSNIKIIDLNATSPELGNYVREELKDLTIKNTSFKEGNVYYMKIRFNLISGF